MGIHQGDVFWITLNETNGVGSNHPHPQVVIQVNAQNKVTVCALTTNLKRAKEPGNVLLDEGEAGLPKQSVIVASQVSTVDAKQLGEFIGTMSEQRIQQVLAGIRFLQIMTQHHE
ncbi:MAG: type II toxin-antitoxin system PemK/MazF family toxin [Chloroflexi bacterium]|nr:type II toxin-antitoxin system PemK/MazF family toxin [Chloroflexota bacterium]